MDHSNRNMQISELEAALAACPEHVDVIFKSTIKHRLDAQREAAKVAEGKLNGAIAHMAA